MCVLQDCVLASTSPESALKKISKLVISSQPTRKTLSWCFLTSLWQLTMTATSALWYLIGYWRPVIKTSGPSLVTLSQSVKRDEASSAPQKMKLKLNEIKKKRLCNIYLQQYIEDCAKVLGRYEKCCKLGTEEAFEMKGETISYTFARTGMIIVCLFQITKRSKSIEVKSKSNEY